MALSFGGRTRLGSKCSDESWNPGAAARLSPHEYAYTEAPRPPRGARPAGVRPAPMPNFVQPCLATLRGSPPRGSEWVHEIKYDGYRLQLRIDGAEVRARTRRGYDWSGRFSTLIAAARMLPVEQAIIDGEV